MKKNITILIFFYINKIWKIEKSKNENGKVVIFFFYDTMYEKYTFFININLLTSLVSF